MSTWSRLVFEEQALGIPGVHSLGQYNYVAARPGLAPHQHAGCVEISLLVKGYQAYQVGTTTYEVRGGEQFVTLPGEMHDTGSRPQDKGILYWLILDVTKARNRFLFLAPEMAQKLILKLLEVPVRHFAVGPEGHLALDRSFRALRKIRKADECTGLFQLDEGEKPISASGSKSQRASKDESCHLLEVATQLVCYVQQTIVAAQENARCISPAIRTSLDFIAKNEEAWLNVGQVAETVKLSESHFKILFREEVGLPPAEYMLRQKIDAAKKALKKPDCNITELAYRLGFSSSQYFATVFKRYTSQTPSEYMGGRVLEWSK